MTDPVPAEEVTALALRVAVAKHRLENADADYKTQQAEAQQVFAGVRRMGLPSVEVLLPSGEPVCVISIETGGTAVTIREDELLAVIATNEPDAFEQYAVNSALSDSAVVALLAEKFPQYVKVRVRPEVDSQYRKEAAENGGLVFMRAGAQAGEQVTVAAVTHLPASGKYSVRWKPKGMDRLGDAIDRGDISQWGVALTGPEPGAVPLPGPLEAEHAVMPAGEPAALAGGELERAEASRR